MRLIPTTNWHNDMTHGYKNTDFDIYGITAVQISSNATSINESNLSTRTNMS